MTFYQVDNDGYIRVPGFQPHFVGFGLSPNQYEAVVKDDGNTYLRMTPDEVLTPSG